MLTLAWTEIVIICRLTCHGTYLQERIDEVKRALLRHKLPFGSRAAEPKPIDAYPFHEDTKITKVPSCLTQRPSPAGCRRCLECCRAAPLKLLVVVLLCIVCKGCAC